VPDRFPVVQIVDGPVDVVAEERAKLLSGFGYTMRHGITQHGIDTGLPTSPGRLKRFQHFRIHTHI